MRSCAERRAQGLPYADLPPWSDWLSRPMTSWQEKLDQMIWVGSPTNPLRQAFRRCASEHFGERLVHRMPDKEQMHELAWRCKPSGACPIARSLNLLHIRQTASLGGIHISSLDPSSDRGTCDRAQPGPRGPVHACLLTAPRVALPSTASGKGCPVKPKQWTPLEEQCRYKYILHLPGISDWLEHFKHQLACGSVNIFIGACQAQTSR